MSNQQPNIVVVVVDALRRDHVGGYDHGPSGLTPTIDALADEGVSFDLAFSTTNATEPAMFSLLSGRHPARGVAHHGTHVTAAERGRAQALPTAPERLQAAGYHTVQTGRGLGRWFADGFDVASDPIRQYGDSETSAVGSVRSRVESVAGALLGEAHPPLAAAVSRRYHDRVRRDDQAVPQLLSEVRRSGDAVFGLVHLMDTHAGYEPAAGLWPPVETNGGRRLVDVAGEYPAGTMTHDRLQRFGRKYADRAHPVRTGYIDALYRGCVASADAKIHRLVDGLQAAGEFENTWLVITADHGESLTEHGIYHDHHGLFPESVRVPLVVRPPGGTAGRQCDELVQLTDLGPTLVQLGNAGSLGPTEGQSLVPVVDRTGEWDSRPGVVVEETWTQHRQAVYDASGGLVFAPGEADACRYCGRYHDDLCTLVSLDGTVREFDAARASTLRHTEAVVRDGFKQMPDSDEQEVDPGAEAALEQQLEALGYRA